MSDADTGDLIQFRLVAGSPDSDDRICLPDARKLQLDACNVVGEDGYGEHPFDFEDTNGPQTIEVNVVGSDLSGRESPIIQISFTVVGKDERPRVASTIEGAARVRSIILVHGETNSIDIPMR